MVYTNLSHEFLLSFVWMKLLRFRKTVIWEELRRHKSSSLGMPKASQYNIQGILKCLSLGMPWKASPLSSSKLSVYLTRSYIFIRHMIYVLPGASFYFTRTCLLLFRIIFCIFYFNKSGIDSLCHAYLASIHVAIWKQKVYRCCKNSRGKSECDKMLKLFA